MRAAFRTLVAALGLILPFAAPVPRAGAQSAPAEPRFAVLTGLEGDVLRHPAAAREFMIGFRSVFASEALPTERRGDMPGTVVVSLPLTNGFHLLEGSSGEGSDQVQLVVDSLVTAPPDTATVAPAAAPKGRRKGGKRVPAPPPPPPSSPWPGVRLVLIVLTPEAVAAGAKPLPIREELHFALSAEGPESFAQAAGRVVGLRALEELHRLVGALDEESRLRWEGRD